MIQKLYKLSSEKENANSSSSASLSDNSHSKLKKREIKQKWIEEQNALESGQDRSSSKELQEKRSESDA